MRLHLAAGQSAAALRQYSRLEQALQEQFAEMPSQVARELAEQVRRQNLSTPQIAPTSTIRILDPHTPTPPALQMQPSGGSLPTGTVTFLVTNIPSDLRERMGEAWATYHRLLREQWCTARRRGSQGERRGLCGGVPANRDALSCALAAQSSLAAHTWPSEVGKVSVRMALDTSDVEVQGEEYHAPVLSRAARLLSAAHGGQILCSESTAGLLRRDPADGVLLKDLVCTVCAICPTPAPVEGRHPPERAP